MASFSLVATALHKNSLFFLKFYSTLGKKLLPFSNSLQRFIYDIKFRIVFQTVREDVITTRMLQKNRKVVEQEIKRIYEYIKEKNRCGFSPLIGLLCKFPKQREIVKC